MTFYETCSECNGTLMTINTFTGDPDDCSCFGGLVVVNSVTIDKGDSMEHSAKIYGEQFELTLGEENSHIIEMGELKSDLAKEGFHIKTITWQGELSIGDEAGNIYNYQAREEGSGTSNEYWGDLPGGWEFCSSTR